MRERTVDVPGAQLVVREWGDRSGEPLVFWHGLNPVGPWLLNEAGPVWAREYGRHVVAVSAPGWETPPLAPDEYRPPLLAGLVVSLLDALALDRVTFAGFSWGASIGVHLAAAYPARLSALVLLDAGYVDFQDQPGFRERTRDELAEELRGAAPRFESWDAYVRAMQERTRIWRPEVEQRLRAAMREEDGAIVARVSAEVVAAAIWGVVADRPSEAAPALADVPLPILLVVARETAGSGWGMRALDRFRAAVPQTEVRWVDSGHDLLTDAPTETTRVVGAWLLAR